MKDYSFVKEAEDHFVVGHPKEGKFKVAKKGLSKSLIKKINSLPKAYPDGTGPEGVQANDDADYPNETEKASESAQENPFLPSWADIKNVASKAGDVAKNIGPYPGASPLLAEQPPNKDIQNTAYSPIPLGQKEGENAVVPAPAQPPQPEQPAKGPIDYLAEMRSGFSGLKGANTNLGNIESDLQKKTQFALDEDNLIRSAQLDNYNVNSKDQVDKINGLKKDIADQKIDPKNLFNKMDTWQKVSAGLGMILAGFGSGLTGGPNMAIQILQNAQEKDIEAQKAELGKKENLLAVNLREYGDMKSAYNATMIQQNEALKNQLMSYAASAQSQSAKQNAIKANALIDMDSNQRMQQIAMSQTMRGMMNGNIPTSPNQLPSLPKEMRDLAVTVPGGYSPEGVPLPPKVMYAASEDARKKVEDATERASDLGASLKRAEDYIAGSPTVINPFGQKAQDAKVLTTDLQTKLTNYMDVSKGFTPEQKTHVQDIVKDLGSLNQTKVKESLKEVKQIMNSSYHSTLKAYLPNYSVPQFSSFESKAKVQ